MFIVSISWLERFLSKWRNSPQTIICWLRFPMQSAQLPECAKCVSVLPVCVRPDMHGCVWGEYVWLSFLKCSSFLTIVLFFFFLSLEYSSCLKGKQIMLLCDPPFFNTVIVITVKPVQKQGKKDRLSFGHSFTYCHLVIHHSPQSDISY